MGSVEEFCEVLAEAGETLVAVSKDANTPELEEAGQRVGEAAASFADRNASLVEQGFVPFFEESLVGGSELRLLCEEIGRPVTLP